MADREFIAFLGSLDQESLFTCFCYNFLDSNCTGIRKLQTRESNKTLLLSQGNRSCQLDEQAINTLLCKRPIIYNNISQHLATSHTTTYSIIQRSSTSNNSYGIGIDAHSLQVVFKLKFKYRASCATNGHNILPRDLFYAHLIANVSLIEAP